MTYDPARLVLALDGVVDELERWDAVASDTLEAAARHQRLTAEALTQVRHRAALLDHQAQVDLARSADQVQSCLGLIAESESTRAQADMILENARRVAASASSVVAHWEFELQAAHAWLQRAQERLRIARAALAAAERELARARSALASAESDLRACQNYRDSEGRRRDCSGQMRQVREAEAWVRDAQAEVRRCEAEVADAEREVAQAEARVDSCGRGVDEAHRAVEAAQAAGRAGDEAVDHGLWCVDHARSGLTAAESAHRTAENEQVLTGQMKSTVEVGAGHVDTAALGNRRANQAGDMAQRDGRGAIMELGRRMDALRRLDLPSL